MIPPDAYPSQMPHSEEVERAILAVVLLAPRLIREMGHIGSLFYLERHLLIWSALEWIYEHDGAEAIDLRTVQARLEATGAFEKVGGLAYLVGLDLELPAIDGWQRYVEILRERAIRRHLAVLGHELKEKASGAVADGEQETGGELAHWAAGKARELAEIAAGEHERDLDDVITEALPPETAPKIVETGHSLLDWSLMLGPQRLHVLGGRPGHLKSTLSMDWAMRAADRGQQVMVFPLEMSGGQVLARRFAGDAGVDFDAYRRGRMSPAQRERAMDVAGLFGSNRDRFHISERTGLTAEELCGLVYRRDARSHLDLIVIDHAGLLRLRTRDTIREIGEQYRLFKMMAMELKTCVVAMHQFSRAFDRRGVGIPTLADFRDSGHIEAHADSMSGLVRPHLFATQILGQEDPDCDPGELLQHVVKDRNGPTGILEWHFDAPRMRITEVDKRRQEPQGREQGQW